MFYHIEDSEQPCHHGHCENVHLILQNSETIFHIFHKAFVRMALLLADAVPCDFCERSFHRKYNNGTSFHLYDTFEHGFSFLQLQKNLTGSKSKKTAFLPCATYHAVLVSHYWKTSYRNWDK